MLEEEIVPTAIEDSIREQHAVGDYASAATVAIEVYGPELLGFLIALTRDEAEAREIFADLCAEIWGGIERFEFRSSFRTWAYAVARHLISHRKRGKRRFRRLSEISRLSQLEARVRTATPLPFRSEVKAQIAGLREQLSQDEQTLLILRVDRELSWKEVALVMLGPENDADGAAIHREAAACRKRYERVTTRLRRLAEAAGLLGGDE